MPVDITSFYTIKERNGCHVITHTLRNECRICQFLHTLGFCWARMPDGKGVYYKRLGLEVQRVTVSEIKEAFRDYLENAILPNNISRDDLMNWYYGKKPIKRNGVLEGYLRDETVLDDEQRKALSISLPKAIKRELFFVK